MNVAPGIAAVSTSMDAVGGTDLGPGVVPLKPNGPGFLAAHGVDDMHFEKSRLVPSVTLVVSSARTPKIGMDCLLVVPSREHLDVRRLMAGD